MNFGLNILTTFATRTACLGLALVSSIVLARNLGPEGQGLFALILLLPELARTLGLLGFDQANVVYAGLKPESRRTLVWQSAIVAGVVGTSIAIGAACFLVVGTAASRFLVHGPLWLYLIPLSMVPVALVSSYWGEILRGMNRISLTNLIQLGTKSFGVLLVVLFVAWRHFDVAGAVWANFLTDVAVIVAHLALLGYVGILARPSFDWSLWRRTRRLAFPAYFGNIMGYLNYRADQFILATLVPTEQLGFYVIAVGLAERVWMLPGVVAAALLPHITNSPKRDPVFAAVVSRHVAIWTGLACLVLFVLAEVVVSALYSSVFAPTVAPLRWLLPGIWLAVPGKLSTAELLAREKINFVWFASTAVPVNVICNLVLIPRMGISGAALASTISYSLLSVIVAVCYVRETGVSWTTLIPRRNDYVSLPRALRARLSAFWAADPVAR